MQNNWRRLGAVLSGAALSLGAVAITPSAEAAASHDPAPGKAASRWLSKQLTGGLLQFAPFAPGGSPSKDDGGSADAVISLTALGGQRAKARKISVALAKDIDNYVTGGSYVKVDPGAAGKAAVALRAAHRPVRNVGPTHRNLIRDIESTVQPSGRVSVVSASGTVDPSAEWANVLSQSYAVKALAAARSRSAARATRFLLTQQCSAGWFRVYFTDTDADPYATVSNDTRCAADHTSGPSVDATAVALAALTPQAHKSRAVKRSIRRAAAWLMKQQLRNGGFTDGTAEAAGHPNANSTGFAGWALGDLGKTRPAKRAAAWLRAHQLQNVGGCTPYAKKDRGALAYDDDAWSMAQTTNLTPNDSQFNSATSQALGVLKWATKASSKARVVTNLRRSRPAGSTLRLQVAGLAPGAVLCVRLGATEQLATANPRGRAAVRLTLPATAGKVRLSATDGTRRLHGVVKVAS
jgi:hypothetical protein